MSNLDDMSHVRAAAALAANAEDAAIWRGDIAMFDRAITAYQATGLIP